MKKKKKISKTHQLVAQQQQQPATVSVCYMTIVLKELKTELTLLKVIPLNVTGVCECGVCVWKRKVIKYRSKNKKKQKKKTRSEE